MGWLEKLNQFKKDSGKTTEEISLLCGVPKGTLNKLFSGQTKDPQLSTLRAVVHFLGKSLDDLDDSDTQNTKIAPVIGHEGESLYERDIRILVANYNALNDDGRKKILEYSSDLASMDRYKKSDFIPNGKEA